MAGNISATPAWQSLQQHVKEIESLHLKDLLQDMKRCEQLTKDDLGLYIDFSRQRMTTDTVQVG